MSNLRRIVENIVILPVVAVLSWLGFIEWGVWISTALTVVIVIGFAYFVIWRRPPRA